jgi:PAS domain S-box-containing protein
VSAAPVPDNETDRLAALRRYGVLDELASDSFERFTRIAAQLFGTSMAIVSFVDENHQWLKGCVGLDAKSTPREVAFCAHAILASEPFVVLDATSHPAFFDNPFVTGPPHIRFYIGAPLITHDHFRLGTLCVIDTVPRPAVDPEQVARLQDLASLVVEHLELIRKTRELDLQRKRTQESERRAELALEAGQMGAWKFNKRTGRSFYSPRMYQLLEIPPDSDANYLDIWKSRVHPDDREQASRTIQQAIEAETDYAVEYRVVFSDGSVHWLADRGHCLLDDAGNSYGATGVCFDITSEKEAAEQLKSSEELFRGISVTSPVGIFLANLQGEIQYVNPRVEQIWRLPAADLMGLGWTAVLHPEDAETVLSGWQKANQAGERYECEYRLLFPDGTVRWLHSQTSVMRDTAGNPSGVCGTDDDVTERKLAEQKLGELQKLLQLAVDTMPQRLFWKDRQGRFLGCNQAFARDLGCHSTAEVIGKTDFSFFSREQAESFIKDDARVRETGVRFDSVEEEWRVAGSSIEWVRTTKIPLRDAAGQVIGILGTYEDITTQKHAADYLRRAKEAAESAARAKGEFLANMSHEIRTPLNAVLGMASLLLMSPLSKEQREWAQTAQSSGEVLLSLLNNVLDLSKAEAGKLTIDRHPFDLHRIVTQCVDLVKTQASLKGLAVDLNYPAGLPRNLVGDSSRLRQVLLNYLANAVKFTSVGIVRLCVRLVSSSPEAVRLRFEVSDTGEGIAPAAQERLFTPFTQADGSTTRRFGGTGLGLCIAKQFTELMGGMVGLESSLGKGSTFWSELSFAIAAQDPDSESPEQEHAFSPIRRMRILLAEDNHINQKVATHMLQNLGYQVDVAADGVEAVQLWSAGHYDLIFMDGQMPHMDGYQATEEIRSRERQQGMKAIPIVALTAHALAGDRERCLIAGMNDYLSKPVDVKALRRVLDTWLHAAPAPARLCS